MKISLVLATFGDGGDLPRFFESLRHQDDVPCEVIVVDQNADERIATTIGRIVSPVPVRHVRARPGLSAARNVGIGLATGDVLGFPDDDCWYPAGFLAAVGRALDLPALDGLTCRCADEHGRLAAGAEDRRSGPVTKRNVWGRGVSATMFFKRAAIASVGQFDEALGLGNPTPFQSGEETDYILRALERGLAIRYRADLTVHHPLPPDSRTARAVWKSRSYGMGMGRVLRMHGFGPLELARHLGSPLIGAACAAALGDTALAKVRIARAHGRYRGWISSDAASRRAGRQVRPRVGEQPPTA